MAFLSLPLDWDHGLLFHSRSNSRIDSQNASTFSDSGAPPGVMMPLLDSPAETINYTRSEEFDPSLCFDFTFNSETSSESSSEAFTSSSDIDAEQAIRTLGFQLEDIIGFNTQECLPQNLVDEKARLREGIPMPTAVPQRGLPPCLLLDQTRTRIQEKRAAPQEKHRRKSTVDSPLEDLALHGAPESARLDAWLPLLREDKLFSDFNCWTTDCSYTDISGEEWEPPLEELLSPLARTYYCHQMQWVNHPSVTLEDDRWRTFSATLQRDVLRTDRMAPYVSGSVILPLELAQTLTDDEDGKAIVLARKYSAAAARALPGANSARLTAFFRACDMLQKPAPLNWFRVYMILLTFMSYRGGQEHYFQGMNDIAILAMYIASTSSRHRATEQAVFAELKEQAEAAWASEAREDPPPFSLSQETTQRLIELDAASLMLYAHLVDIHPVRFGQGDMIGLLRVVGTVQEDVDPQVRQLLLDFCLMAPRDGDVILVGVAPAVLMLKRSFSTFPVASRFFDWFIVRATQKPRRALASAVAAFSSIVLRPWLAQRISTFHDLCDRRQLAYDAFDRELQVQADVIVSEKDKLVQRSGAILRALSEKHQAWRKKRDETRESTQAKWQNSLESELEELAQVRARRDASQLECLPPIPTEEQLRQRMERRCRRELREVLAQVGQPPQSMSEAIASIVKDFYASLATVLEHVSRAMEECITQQRDEARKHKMDGRYGELVFDVSEASNILQDSQLDDATLLIEFSETIFCLPWKCPEAEQQ